jgi:hypothetical protein
LASSAVKERTDAKQNPEYDWESRIMDGKFILAPHVSGGVVHALTYKFKYFDLQE